MKVLLINGSPTEKGCTYTALCEVAGALNKNQIETEIIQIGAEPVAGCSACLACKKSGFCIIDDGVNDFLEKAKSAHGFVFGSPVYFAGASGNLTSFMDRVFHVPSRINFKGKPAAAVVSCRRAGTTAALDRIFKYFEFAQMPIVSSQYWNMVHGNTPEEVKQDLEGLQIMRALGNNMAWLLKCIEAGAKAGIKFPENEPRISTNFIR